MKRWIHSHTSSVQAEKEITKYDPQQVAYVQKCRNEMINSVDPEQDEKINHINMGIIKSDYMMEAADSGLLTEEEFEDILNLLDLREIEFQS